MVDAVVARQQGDNFQARLFWLHAAQLLDPKSSVRRVSYETGPKAFDDVVVEYASVGAPKDHEGQPFFRDHLQCKWHVRNGDFTYVDLTQPKFIGATSTSLLQRARSAQLDHAPSGLGARFKLVTNWRLERNDPLLKLIQTQTNALDLERLFDGGPRGAIGLLRSSWCAHLDINEEALRILARTIAIAMRLESADELRDRVNDKFAKVGMREIPADETGFFYDDLITKLHGQGRKEFDRESFAELVRSEKLLVGDKEPERTAIGVRSFLHSIDDLGSRTTAMLDLVPFFEGRFLKDEKEWDADIYPALKTFILAEARTGDHLQLVLDAHISLAFAIGSILNVKSGKDIEVEQRTNGRRFWSRDDLPIDPAWPMLDVAEEQLGAGAELAVAIGLTHKNASAVRNYLKNVPAVGTLLVCSPVGGTSGASVRSGSHAMKMAEQVVEAIRSVARPKRTHLFLAAPNGFNFFLGQHKQMMGPCTIYEWDFEGIRSGSYSPGLTL